MEELRLKLIEDINNSKLPLEAVLFVVRDVYRDVESTFRDAASEVSNTSAEE